MSDTTCRCKMEEYLTSTLNKLKTENYAQLTIVLGNQSCDLDSAICSLVYAAFLNWQYQQMKSKVCTKEHRDENTYKDEIFLAIFNTERDDYLLKTEVYYCLQRHGIDESKLIFRDDLNLEHLIAKTRTNIVLVDHHILSKNDLFLTDHVSEVIDHRPLDRLEWKFKEGTKKCMEIVGSCTTLVAERIKNLSALLSTEVEFFYNYMSCTDLLHSTIILDTVNFSKQVDKATLHDEEIVLFLESILKPENFEVERKNKVDRLLAARSDISQFNAKQLLRKDTKVIGNLLVPSFPMLVEDFFMKPGALEAINEELARNNCHTALLLGHKLLPALERDCCAYAPDRRRSYQLSKFLEEWASPTFLLTIQGILSNRLDIYYFKQLNISASRKQYIQALNAYIAKYKE